MQTIVKNIREITKNVKFTVLNLYKSLHKFNLLFSVPIYQAFLHRVHVITVFSNQESGTSKSVSRRFP